VIPVVVQYVQTKPFTSAGKLPAAFRARQKPDVWYVRSQPFGTEGPGWEWNMEGEVFRVPLFPYLTKTVDPENAMAFAFQLGLSAGYEVSGGDEIAEVHLAVGLPMEDLGEQLRYWLGVAFRMRKR
jgi:hypothetical protein